MKYIVLLSLLILSCTRSSTYIPTINGVTLEGSSTVLGYGDYKKVDTLSPNYIAIIPFAYLSSQTSADLIQHPSWQWWGEDSIGVIETIKMARQSGHQVMIKPQLWIRPPFFTGDYKCVNNEDWERFEKGYRTYILTYAKISQKYGVEILCIGNELKSFVSERPQFWDTLITEVRQKFKGKITYAANWDNYDKISFWESLDFIGINAYFPLVNSSEPNVKEIKEAWEPTADLLMKLSEKIAKKILFTEYGYRSISFATKSPWESYTDEKLSLQTQQNAYDAFYQTFWNKEFVQGGFLWKWRVNGKVSATDKSYSIVGKPAAEVVREYYKKGVNTK